MNEYNSDWMDGREVPQLVIKEDYILVGTHPGTVHVKAGRFTLSGTIQGTLDIQPGVIANINGKQQGTVSIASEATVTVTGAIEGSTTVQRGAVLIVEAGGKVAGSLNNSGTVIVRGVFGGRQTGAGEFRLERSGYIKQPTIQGGSTYYNW